MYDIKNDLQIHLVYDKKRKANLKSIPLIKTLQTAISFQKFAVKIVTLLG